MIKKEIVISAYQRDYSWIKYLNSDVLTTIYRKGENTKDVNEIFIKNNIGQDVHTFFNHILRSYNRLPFIDYMIFSQDFPFDHVANYIDIINANPNYWDETCKQKIGSGYWAFSTASALNWEHPMPKDAYTGKTLICREDGFPHHKPPELNIASLWVQLFSSPVPEKFEFVPAGHFIVDSKQVKIRSDKFYERLVNILETRKFAPWEVERIEPYIFNKDYESLL